MKLSLNDEQQELARTARNFAAKHCDVSRLRALRDSHDVHQYSPDVWKHMAQLGWFGVHISEDHGGIGLGFAELTLILEALAAGLAPEPLIPSLVLGALPIEHAGSESQKQQWLPLIAEGTRLFTLAHQESTGDYTRSLCETTASQQDGKWHISGQKLHVLNGGNATDFIVVARTSGNKDDAHGLTLFHVDGQANGLTRTPLNRLDSRNAAHISLDNVPATAVIGTVGEALHTIDYTLDRATIALCSESLGAMQRAFDVSIQYLKERVQFDVPIGSFQALQHRAANLYADLELARSMVLAAARAVDQDASQVPLLAAGAKSLVDDTFLHITREGIQFHGGVGVTDEYDIGLYLKRAHVNAATFGDASWQRARWAMLSGY